VYADGDERFVNRLGYFVSETPVQSGEALPVASIVCQSLKS
jgi:hypothetical protein